MSRILETILTFFGKLYKVIVYGSFILIFAVMIRTGLGSAYGDEDVGKEKVADGFTISSYNVSLDVREDNKIDVTENITVDWYEAYHHGIYKFTPYWLQYTAQDGKTIRRKANILNYRAVGEPYSLDTVKKKARIKIGNANAYVGEGLKTYVIKYTYDMGKDPYKGFDELIFHAFGDYWGTEIKNASINVTMPKSIEGYNVNFFTDKFRKNNVTDVVDYDVRGNTLYATFNSSYNKLESSLTLDIELPEGYFVGGSWNYGWGSFIISMIIFILTAWTIYKWIKFGKDHPKRVQTVEFYPPDNLSAAEIGYVYNQKQTSKKFTIALIIELASKKYIKIDEVKDKDKNIEITNLIPKPREVKEFNNTLDKRVIEIRKLKDIDSNLTRKEKTMMTYLFKKDNTKVLDTNIDKFLEVRDNLVNSGYIEIIRDNDDIRKKDLEDRKVLYDKEVAQYNLDIQKYNEEITKLPELSSLEKIVYDRLFETEDVIILSEHKTFYQAFREVDVELKNDFKDRVIDKHANKEMTGALIRNIIILILSLVSYSVIEDLDPAWNIIYYLAFICNFINLFFTLFMGRRTEYGEYIMARVKGFRHFLLVAEKDRLEALVSKNPNYFYDILPYTYALNISRKWIKKFENIPMPEVEMGTFDYSNDSSFYSLYDSVYVPASSSSSSGGCSSCGGGCSSCGGGCSSCGGGGSW